MSNNSMVCRRTGDGVEIGRAQWIQAVAARADPEAAMNPVLLKPGSDRRSHVVLMGQPWRRGVARRTEFDGPARAAREAAHAAYDDLRRRASTSSWPKAPAARPRSTCAQAITSTWGSPGTAGCRPSSSVTSTAAACSRRCYGTLRLARRRRPGADRAGSWSTSSAATWVCCTPGLRFAERAHRPSGARRAAVATPTCGSTPRTRSTSPARPAHDGDGARRSRW